MAVEVRERMIAAFTTDPRVTVFLMSLKAGGVALNLTAARWGPVTSKTICIGLRAWELGAGAGARGRGVAGGGGGSW